MTDLDGHICRDCGVYFTTKPDVFAWRCENCRPAPDPDKPVTISMGRPYFVGVDPARGDDQAAVAVGTVNEDGGISIDYVETIGPATVEEISRKIQEAYFPTSMYEEIARAFAIPPKILRSKSVRRKIEDDALRRIKDRSK